MTILVRRALAEERPELRCLLAQRWGSTEIVSRDRVTDAAAADAFVAVRAGTGDGDAGRKCGIVGVATLYVRDDEEAELLTLDALEEGLGIGSALVDAVAKAAAAAHARRLVVSTTNDNLRALALYQRRGFRLLELRAGAIDRARVLKPSIPLVGSSGIPIRDELVLVRDLDASLDLEAGVPASTSAAGARTGSVADPVQWQAAGPHLAGSVELPPSGDAAAPHGDVQQGVRCSR